jgi:hypothetical protein
MTNQLTFKTHKHPPPTSLPSPLPCFLHSNPQCSLTPLSYYNSYQSQPKANPNTLPSSIVHALPISNNPGIPTARGVWLDGRESCWWAHRVRYYCCRRGWCGRMKMPGGRRGGREGAGRIAWCDRVESLRSLVTVRDGCDGLNWNGIVLDPERGMNGVRTRY